jgi:hypothetical protein
MHCHERAELGSLAPATRYQWAGQRRRFRGSGGGVHRPKFKSFEFYRRNLYEPEVITFDELLARNEWHVTLAEIERQGLEQMVSRQPQRNRDLVW